MAEGENTERTTSGIIKIAQIFPADHKKLSESENLFFDAIDIRSVRKKIRKSNQRYDNPAFYSIFLAHLESSEKKSLNTEDIESFNKFLSRLKDGQNSVKIDQDFINELIQLDRNSKDPETVDAWKKYINSQDSNSLTDNAKRYILEYIEKESPRIIECIRAFRKIYKAGIFDDWARGGDLTYKYSIFSPSEDIHAILETVKPFYIDMLGPYTGAKNLARESQIIDEALAKLEEKINAREAAIAADLAAKIAADNTHAKLATALEQKQAEDARRRAEAAKDADARAAKAAANHTAFMASAQPYALSDSAQKIWSQIQKFSESTAQDAGKAKALITAAEEARKKLDIRDPAVAALGALLFSPVNLMAAAAAVGADNPFKNEPAHKNPANHSSDLNALKASESAKKTLVELLKTDGGLLLLATLTRKPERSAAYVRKHRAVQDETVQATTVLNNERASLTASLGDFSDADLADLETQMEVQKFRAAECALAEKTAEMDKIRSDFAAEVEQAIGGLGRNRITAANLTVISNGTNGVTLPDGWKEKLGDEFHAEALPDNKKILRIISNEFPFKYVDIKNNAGGKALNDRLNELRTECEIYRANATEMEKLTKESGFQIAEQNGKIALTHPEYGISVPLDTHTPEAEITAALVAARARFDERHFQQTALIEMAQQFNVPVPQTPRGYFTADTFTALKHAINEARPKPNLENVRRLGELTKPSDAPTTWQPGEDQTLMIFDASTLHRLAVPRGDNGHTWLDIIKCTARLPNVKVIIPAVVAEWELQGKVPAFDEAGHYKASEIIDKRFADPKHMLGEMAGHINHFLKSASRVTINPDGSTHFIPNDNRNLIIMDTPGDRELYKRIRANPTSSADIKGHDEGENSIDRIVDTFAVPSMIVSDDLKYTDTRKPTSKLNQPVGQAGTARYLHAEIRAREPMLRHILRESDPLSLTEITDKVNAYWSQWGNDGEGNWMCYHNIPGRNQSNEATESIHALIDRGAAQRSWEMGVRSQSNGQGAVRGAT